MPRKPRDQMKPTSRWRKGERTPETLAAHAEEVRRMRREITQALFPPVIRNAILDRVASGEPLRAVAKRYNVSINNIYGLAYIDPEFDDALDAAQKAAVPPDVKHGTVTAYRFGRCRCRDCRRAKTRSRKRIYRR